MHKSKQACREVIAANSGKVRAYDAAFFDNLETRYGKLAANSNHPADFRRLSAEVRAYAGELANRDDWNAGTHGPVFEVVTAYADMIDMDIENRAALREAGVVPGGDAQPGQWRDAKTGEAIKLYAPQDKIHNGPASKVGVGDLLEGMLFGPKTPDIKNALESTTDTAGGYTVPTEIMREFIDKLRAATVFIQAGARTMALNGITRIVRLDTDPTATWRAENSDIGDSNIVLGDITMTPHSLSTLVRVPYELLADSVNIADILQKALIGALSTELDRACLFGTGSSNQPLGLFGTSGINSTSMGTNGAVPTNYDDLLDLLYNLENSNEPDPSAVILHPRTARTYRKMKDTTNQPLRAPDPLGSIPVLSTTAIPITQTQGNVSTASTVFMGDFSQAILGMREELHIVRLDQTFAQVGQVGFWARMRADVGFAHGQSFAKLIGVLP